MKRTIHRMLACLLALVLCGGIVSAALADNTVRTTIRRGSSGDDVTYMQQFLKTKGYYNGPVTGHMGNNTTRALQAYQRDQGLTADGIAGQKTWSTVLGAMVTATNATATPAPGVAAAPAATLSPNALGTVTLRYGVRSEAVRALQTRLKELGFFSDSVTGYFGTVTRASVRAFQRANGLTADGIVGSATRAKLYGHTVITPESTEQTTIDPGATVQPLGYGVLGTQTLKKGMSLEAVRVLQTQLKALGYYTGTVTGSFGTQTKQAVMDFQRKNGLTADGIVGSATRGRLYAVADTAYGTTSGTLTGNTTSTATAAPAQEELGTGTMQLNDQSETVRALQRKLAALGYYDGAITGHYGRKTKQAVMDFQKANGISRDGVAGGTTLKKLNAAATATPAPTPTPVPTPTPEPTPTPVPTQQDTSPGEADE